MYRPVLTFALRARWAIVAAAVLLVSVSGVMATKLGSEFVPNLDEGDIAMHALRIPGTSLSQSIEMQKLLEEKVKQLPEVERVFSKIGTPDVATDPMPPKRCRYLYYAETKRAVAKPDKLKVEVVAELEELVSKVPGNKYEFLQPIQMRFNELLAGVRAELAIKIFGDDFETLAQVGKSVEAAIKNVEGIRDVQVEQTKGLPILTFVSKDEKLARYGISKAEFQTQVATALGGQNVGKYYEGDKRFDIVVR